MFNDISPLWISLKTSLIATTITFFLGIIAAYWMLGYRGKWRSLIEGIFILPLILPPTVVGFLLLVIFGKYGILGQFLASFNINIVFTWYAAVITATVVAFPLMYKTALGAFEQIDANLIRAARTLGASEWTVFWRVSFPLAIPGIIGGATLAFARALGEFGATLMLAGNIPGQTQTIPMAIYFSVEGGSMQEAWGWALVIMGISLSGIVAVNYWQQSRGKRREARGKRQEESTTNYQLPITNYQLPIIESKLFVNIQKQLAEFDLNVTFSNDDRPLGLLGASGAGKSMILRCLAGIETPNAGKIELNGRVLFDSQRQINLPTRDRKIGFLFQNYALFPHLTIGQNIAFGLPKATPKKQVIQVVETQLASMQLHGCANRYPHQLSGGQQQRVALARALASQPEALLLDEPFSALDTHLRSQLEQQLISILSNYQGVTLFVSHNLEEAYRVCQNLLVMEKGTAIASGSKHDIFERPQTYSVAQLTGCKNFSCAEIAVNGMVKATDWGIELQVTESISKQLKYVGIRAHQIIFTTESNRENTFPCFLAQTSETPHRMTVYLKLYQQPTHSSDYHLQAEVFKEKWEILKGRSFPWYIRLDPMRLILMT
ncbi:molybdate ABC transporter permease subunit [Chroococcidiopsis sp. CCNUC1]|uniref:molybdate ABC transporter permease subunit n=1 Tax=Chroococcidiopsis sp. CCNUC1 TaxID=2653189 RepID=UPI0020212066|nr:molybdate ABC transporter permease subunit [Chroococcidiopsis sp. CCNUC1]URD52637.1 molybdate ABC transporter permease subunit [Chroococcidiopsis sp. CCNUC1]